MAAAWKMDLPMTEKMVLLCLCDYANDEGVCWPAVGTIAGKCSCTDRTVQNAIKALKSKGILSTKDVPGRSHMFAIDPRSIFTPEFNSPPKMTTKGVNDVRGRGEPNSPKPSMNHQEPSKDDVDAERQPPLSVDEVVEAWNLTAERKGLRKAVKVTPQRRKQIQARIRQNTITEWQEALAAIERSRFCCGENDRGWRADLDFLLQPKSFTRLIEGFYDGAR